MPKSFAQIVFICSALSIGLIFAPLVRAQNPSAESLADRIVNAASEAERENLLNENRSLANAELAAALLARGRQAIGKNDFKTAERAFASSLKIAETANDQAGIAVALRQLGGVSGMQGDFARALDYFRRAVAAYEAAADETGLLAALRGVGSAESSLGNYENGLAAFRRLLALAEKISDKSAQSNAHSSLNIVYQNTGDFAAAELHGARALTLARETNDKRSIGAALSNLATLKSSMGDHQFALRSHAEALLIFEEQDDQQRIALTLNNIGEIYLRQNDFESAENHFRRGLALRETIGDRDGAARSLLRLGELKIRQNDLAAALEFLQRSLSIRETVSKEPAAHAAVLTRIGDVYSRQNDSARAGEFYNRALPLAESVGERETLAVTLVSLARFHLAKSERETALQRINRAIEIAARLNLRDILWQAQTVAGEIALAGADKTRARQSFEAAAATIDDARFLVAGAERERQQFFENKIEPFHRMIELLYAEKRFAEAFAYAQRAKGRSLLDVLQTGRAPLEQILNGEELARETALRRAFAELSNQLRIENTKTAPDTKRVAELNRRISEARGALAAFTAALYAARPELQMRRGEAKIANLDDTKILLPDEKTALVEFVVTDRQTFAFVVAANDGKPVLQVVSIPINRADLTAQIADLRGALARRDLRFAESSRKIYDWLVAPLKDRIYGKSSLIVAPDAALWELPFAALRSPAGKYLLETHAVAYAPSLSVLINLETRKKVKDAEQNLLAFGNPAHQSVRRAAAGNPNPVLQSGEFADLPEAVRQVETIVKMFAASRARILTGAAATEAEFKRSAARYRILHLATHGVLDDASPLYSYILLADERKNETEAEEDGKLEAREILRMNLNADLVVLSACETARGRVSTGEGLIGLSWAFFVAGAPATVASQWKVESAGTTELMLGFYRGMQQTAKPISKTENLRRAALALMKSERYAHPFYWAGFVIIGDAN